MGKRKETGMTTDCNTCYHYDLDGLFPEPCRYEVWNDDKGRCSMYRAQPETGKDGRKVIKEGTK